MKQPREINARAIQCRCSWQQVLAYVTLAVVSFLRTAELLTLFELSLGADGARADRDLAADTAAEAHVQRVTALAVPELRAVALVVICKGGGRGRAGDIANYTDCVVPVA